jgi:tRNA pseudouridine38-40 synthase
MKRFLLECAYDGSRFYGWQVQRQSPTVQECLERALSKIAKEKIIVIGAGRTDSGVHALAQVAHFDFPVEMTTEQIMLAFRSKLPSGIKINRITEVASDFHARYNAIERTYRYIITFNQTPFNYYYKAAFHKYHLDQAKFQACIPYFLGEHNFTSFAKPNPEITNHLCNITNFIIEKQDDDLIIEITANRFLHNMVRRIVGAMVAVSHKSLNPNIITDWIASKQHNQKNYITAPPNGLYLVRVVY